MPKSSSHTTLVAGLILFLCAGIYGIFQARELIVGPRIVVESPRNGATVDRSLVVIAGHAKNISAISLNGRTIFVDNNGRFSEQLLLADGYNIITVEAKSRFGKETKETLELVYKEGAPTPKAALRDAPDGPETRS